MFGLVIGPTGAELLVPSEVSWLAVNTAWNLRGRSL